MYAGLDSVTIWSQDLRVRILNWDVQERRGRNMTVVWIRLMRTMENRHLQTIQFKKRYYSCNCAITNLLPACPWRWRSQWNAGHLEQINEEIRFLRRQLDEFHQAPVQSQQSVHSAGNSENEINYVVPDLNEIPFLQENQKGQPRRRNHIIISGWEWKILTYRICNDIGSLESKYDLQILPTSIQFTL